MLKPAPPRCCERCCSTDHLRLKDSVTLWHEGLPVPQRVNIYVCVDRQACSDRLSERVHFLKEADLWRNYHDEHRKRRYTPRKYWREGRRLTFAMAQMLLMQAGLRLEKGQTDFPEGLRSGYIVNREWRYTSLLEAIKLIEQKPKTTTNGRPREAKAKRPCRRR